MILPHWAAGAAILNFCEYSILSHTLGVVHVVSERISSHLQCSLLLVKPSLQMSRLCPWAVAQVNLQFPKAFELLVELKCIY